MGSLSELLGAGGTDVVLKGKGMKDISALGAHPEPEIVALLGERKNGIFCSPCTPRC